MAGRRFLFSALGLLAAGVLLLHVFSVAVSGAGRGSPLRVVSMRNVREVARAAGMRPGLGFRPLLLRISLHSRVPPKEELTVWGYAEPADGAGPATGCAWRKAWRGLLWELDYFADARRVTIESINSRLAYCMGRMAHEGVEDIEEIEALSRTLVRVVRSYPVFAKQ